MSHRTLTRFEESGRLTRTLAVALENHLALGGGTAAAAQRQRVGVLEDGLAELARALRDGLAAVRKEGQAMSEAQARALAQLQERVAALEAGPGGQGVAAPGGKSGGGDQAAGGTPGAGGAGQVKPGSAGTAPARPPRRDYPELVTAEPEPGEERVYGAGATAVIIRWRKARDEFAAATDKLVKLDAQERRLELEVALIEEHRLTLPPATYPWDWGDRRQEAQRRTLVLDDVIKDRARLKLRRFLTLGLWR